MLRSLLPRCQPRTEKWIESRLRTRRSCGAPLSARRRRTAPAPWSGLLLLLLLVPRAFRLSVEENARNSEARGEPRTASAPAGSAEPEVRLELTSTDSQLRVVRRWRRPSRLWCVGVNVVETSGSDKRPSSAHGPRGTPAASAAPAAADAPAAAREAADRRLAAGLLAGVARSKLCGCSAKRPFGKRHLARPLGMYPNTYMPNR
jgi:hypothetical protein